MDVVDGTVALRLLNHYIRQRQDCGETPEELAPLETVRDWIRGMVAIDIMVTRTVDSLPARTT